jgi:hypothetical protein
MNNILIHSINFNFDFHPNPLETVELAKEILDTSKIKQGIKEIHYKGNRVIYVARPNFKGVLISEKYNDGIIINYISK